jgi:hypothetical protein
LEKISPLGGSTSLNADCAKNYSKQFFDTQYNSLKHIAKEIETLGDIQIDSRDRKDRHSLSKGTKSVQERNEF